MIPAAIVTSAQRALRRRRISDTSPRALGRAHPRGELPPGLPCRHAEHPLDGLLADLLGTEPAACRQLLEPADLVGAELDPERLPERRADELEPLRPRPRGAQVARLDHGDVLG